MASRLTPFGIKVKKRLLDLHMTQTEFCKKYDIPRNRFTEMITGLRPNHKYVDIVNEALGFNKENRKGNIA